MDDLKLIPAPSAAEAARHFDPTPLDAPAPAAGQAPAAYLAALIAAGHLVAAGAYLAAALPRREAVWWGCRCLRSVLAATAPPAAEAALVAAETWAAAPGDSNRRKAMAAAEAIGFADPAGCLALAAFLSGGSLVPPHLKDVPPPDHAFARALAGALQLAAARAEPAQIGATHRRFLDLGLAVARGADRWPPSL